MLDINYAVVNYPFYHSSLLPCKPKHNDQQLPQMGYHSVNKLANGLVNHVNQYIQVQLQNIVFLLLLKLVTNKQLVAKLRDFQIVQYFHRLVGV